MKLLHTSDWHIGRMLFTRKDRQDEHAAFLHWLLKAIKEHSIDLLIVAGDVFDTAAPSNSAQKMYYDFLVKVHQSGCQNMVVIGGNHDSPSFLNAPKEILAALNVCVVGNAGDNPEDEVIVIRDKDGKPLTIVCAVPFLRERDISRFTEGESYDDRTKRIASSIQKHYELIVEKADKKRQSLNNHIPIIATGHLSVAGGKTVEDDGVRDTYIGSIECIGSEIFPPLFDYVALGHYHIPSVIANHIRYCGSPIPMGFGEAKQKKLVFVVEFEEDGNRGCKIEPLEIPVFQKMESIRGDRSYIYSRLIELIKSDSAVWVEIVYEGNDVFPDLPVWANELTALSKVEIVNIQNRNRWNEELTLNENKQSLDELNPYEVFNNLLERKKISEEQKEELKKLYREIIFSLEND